MQISLHFFSFFELSNCFTDIKEIPILEVASICINVEDLKRGEDTEEEAVRSDEEMQN